MVPGSGKRSLPARIARHGLLATIGLLATTSLAGCLKLAPSPFQEVGPIIGAALGQPSTTTTPTTPTTPTTTTTVPDKYVIVGDNGTVLLSSDGISWSLVTFPTALQLNAVAWNGTRFIAVGHGPIGGGQPGQAYHSTDGSSWTQVAVSACFGGTTEGRLRGVAANSTGRVVAVGQSNGSTVCAAYSDDHGSSWTTATTPGDTAAYAPVVATNTGFLTTQQSNQRPHRSSDGTAFTANGSTPLNGAGSPTSAAYLSAQSVAIVHGEGPGKSAPRACHSTDGGATFGTCQAIFGGTGSSYTNAMASSSTRIVAVGDTITGNCGIDFTQDFTNFVWQGGGAAMTITGCTSQLQAIAHDGSKFIASGASGTIGRSATGGTSDWTFQTQGTQTLRGIAISYRTVTQ